MVLMWLEWHQLWFKGVGIFSILFIYLLNLFVLVLQLKHLEKGVCVSVFFLFLPRERFVFFLLWTTSAIRWDNWDLNYLRQINYIYIISISWDFFFFYINIYIVCLHPDSWRLMLSSNSFIEICNSNILLNNSSNFV